MTKALTSEGGAEGSALEERYHRLVDLAPDGILIHDGERILMANIAAIRLAGATHLRDLIGRAIDEFLNPPYLKALEERLLTARDQEVSAEPVQPVRDTFRRLDGTTVEVEVTAIPFVDDGRPAAHLVIRDLTEQLAAEAATRLAEEHLRAAQKMEAVGALAGGVAHEVNNMMTVVLGFSEFLIQDPALPQGRIEDVQEIRRAAGRASTVTRQLLAFSRRGMRVPRTVSLDSMALNLAPLIRRLLGEGLHFTSTLSCPHLVSMDPGQLEQIVVNLALNSRDAMPPGGTLTFSTGQAVLKERELVGHHGEPIPAGRYGLITLRDTGAGMDEAIRSRIFEPFFTTKPIGQGTGLGLPAVQGIMEQSGGYITVASTPGVGTQFTLLFPLLRDAAVPVVVADAPDEPPPLGALSPAAGATILVADDEPALRSIVARSLEGYGFRVLQAGDGLAALEIVREQGAPDLVLTDLMMPRMGGAELARRLQTRWPGLLVLFMSGYSEDHLRRAGALEGGERVIEKPFTPETLLRNVDAALQARVL